MPTILLVEDEGELARVISRELEAEGYQVMRAGTGPEALALHARHQPDLVILDWMLPGLDGLEVLRRIRQAAHEGSGVPVLMLTARGEEMDRVVGLEVGADDYMAISGDAGHTQFLSIDLEKMILTSYSGSRFGLICDIEPHEALDLRDLRPGDLRHTKLSSP
jgi:CheY-like chemotaxis protein